MRSPPDVQHNNSQDYRDLSADIDPILQGWPYRPDEINVRLIDGDDGGRKIQLRLDLGILQMEIDGRPDGRRIHECDSWLEYHQKRQMDHDAANPDGKPYLLEPEDCAELQREGVQYYHRYISFWHLQRYELCAATRSAICGCLPSSASTPATIATKCSSINGGPT